MDVSGKMSCVVTADPPGQLWCWGYNAPNHGFLGVPDGQISGDRDGVSYSAAPVRSAVSGAVSPPGPYIQFVHGCDIHSNRSQWFPHVVRCEPLGGQRLRLYGLGLALRHGDAPTITVGGVSCANVTRHSTSYVSCALPPHNGGAHALRLTRQAMTADGEVRATEWRGVVRYESQAGFEVPVPSYVTGCVDSPTPADGTSTVCTWAPATRLTIVGWNFGSAATAIRVQAGDVTCTDVAHGHAAPASSASNKCVAMTAAPAGYTSEHSGVAATNVASLGAVRCATGYAGAATVSCPTPGAAFVFAGCAPDSSRCAVPSDHPLGYRLLKLGALGTTPLSVSGLGAVRCADGWLGHPTVDCPAPNGPFRFRGCGAAALVVSALCPASVGIGEVKVTNLATGRSSAELPPSVRRLMLRFLSPVVVGVEPTAGSLFGGTELIVSVIGAGAATVPTITVAGRPCTNVRRLNATRLRCSSPAYDSGMEARATPAGAVASLCGGSFPHYSPAGGERNQGDLCLATASRSECRREWARMFAKQNKQPKSGQSGAGCRACQWERRPCLSVHLSVSAAAPRARLCRVESVGSLPPPIGDDKSPPPDQAGLPARLRRAPQSERAILRAAGHDGSAVPPLSAAAHRGHGCRRHRRGAVAALPLRRGATDVAGRGGSGGLHRPRGPARAHGRLSRGRRPQLVYGPEWGC